METEQKKTLIIHLIIIPLSFTLSGITRRQQTASPIESIISLERQLPMAAAG